MKARIVGEKGRDLCPRLVQKMESKTEIKKKNKAENTRVSSDLALGHPSTAGRPCPALHQDMEPYVATQGLEPSSQYKIMEPSCLALKGMKPQRNL